MTGLKILGIRNADFDRYQERKCEAPEKRQHAALPPLFCSSLRSAGPMENTDADVIKSLSRFPFPFLSFLSPVLFRPPSPFGESLGLPCFAVAGSVVASAGSFFSLLLGTVGRKVFYKKKKEKKYFSFPVLFCLREEGDVVC